MGIVERVSRLLDDKAGKGHAVAGHSQRLKFLASRGQLPWGLKNLAVNTALNAAPLTLLLWLAAGYIAMAALFAIAYYPLEITHSAKADWWNRYVDCLHYSFTTQATVGYGDLSPKGTARWIAAIQAFLGILLNAAVLGIFTARLLKRKVKIAFPQNCCYDPKGDSFVFRFLNVDADDLLQVSVRLTLDRHTDDPQVTRQAYGIALQSTPEGEGYHPSGHLWAIRSMPRNHDMKTDARSLQPTDNIMFPEMLRSDDILTLAVTGYSATGGNLVVHYNPYKISDIVCGRYVQANEKLTSLNDMQLTERSSCRRCADRLECRFSQRPSSTDAPNK